MPFQFSLRALLRLRHIEERRERLRLTLLNTARGRLHNEYEEAGRQTLLDFERLDRRLHDGISGGEFRFEENSLEALHKRRREISAMLEALDLQIQKQIGAFSESQKKRKILENLRERELHVYQQAENRREQQRIDDLFARRRHR